MISWELAKKLKRAKFPGSDWWLAWGDKLNGKYYIDIRTKEPKPTSLELTKSLAGIVNPDTIPYPYHDKLMVEAWLSNKKYAREM